MLTIGTRVNFKKDYEGRGIIAKAVKHTSWDGEVYYEYAIKSLGEPNGYQFHRAAIWDNEVNAMVVWVDEDHIF